MRNHDATGKEKQRLKKYVGEVPVSLRQLGANMRLNSLPGTPYKSYSTVVEKCQALTGPSLGTHINSP